MSAPWRSNLYNLRRTEGITTEGRHFILTDDMDHEDPEREKRTLYKWIGRTTFYSKASHKKHYKLLESCQGTA